LHHIHPPGHYTLELTILGCQQSSKHTCSFVTENYEIVTVTVTEFHSSTELFTEESCSVIGLSEKVSFQLRSKLLATDVWWAEVMWKCVPDDSSRDGETSPADGRVFPRNEHVTAAGRAEWPAWQIRDWADDLLEVDRTSDSHTFEGQVRKIQFGLVQSRSNFGRLGGNQSTYVAANSH